MPPVYDRLSYVDRQFLIFEGRSTHMHIGGSAIFEGGALRRPDGGLDIDRIRAFIESRLPRIPRYRQVVSFTPFGRHIWLDDPHFNIEYHVRHTSLPRPGGEKQFKALCGRVFSQALDRSKPLWEVWIVDGVEGDRVRLHLQGAPRDGRRRAFGRSARGDPDEGTGDGVRRPRRAGSRGEGHRRS